MRQFVTLNRHPAFIVMMLVQLMLGVAVLILWHDHIVPLLNLHVLTVAVGACVGVLVFVVSRRAIGFGKFMIHWRIKPMLIKAAILTVNASAEELIWRGFVLFWLTQALTVTLGITVSTLGFAATHVYAQGWKGFAAHLLTGAVFAATCIFLHSVGAAIAAHIVYNLLILAADEERRSARLVLERPLVTGLVTS